MSTGGFPVNSEWAACVYVMRPPNRSRVARNFLLDRFALRPPLSGVARPPVGTAQPTGCNPPTLHLDRSSARSDAVHINEVAW